MFQGNLHEYEGEMLTVKVIAGKVSLAPSTLYKYLKKGFSLYESIEEGKKQSKKTFKNRTKTNNTKTKLYKWNNKMMSVNEIAESEGISPEPLYRRLKKGIELSVAINEIKNNISPKYPFLGSLLTKYQISRLTGIPKHYLDKSLLDNIKYTEEEVIKILKLYKKQEILMYGDETLLEYCKKNNYNYHIIYNLIKTKCYTVEEAITVYTNPNYKVKENNEVLMHGNETLRSYCLRMKYNYNSVYYGISVLGCSVEQAISRYIHLGQTSNPSYQYKVGDILFFHFLIKVGLDDRFVLYKMRKGKSKEESIIDAIFLSKEEYKTKSIRNKLRAIYSEIKDINELVEIRNKYALTQEDIDFIIKKEEEVKNIIILLKVYEGVCELRETMNITQFAKTFMELGLSLTDLLDIVETLYDGFEEQELSKPNQLKYIWHKGM